MRFLVLAATVLLAFVAAGPHGRGKGGHSHPCEVPSYIEDLPEDAKKKVQDIWKDWKEGDSCYEQRGQTREVIDSLTKEQRKKLFKKGGFLPPFIRKAPADVQEKFRAIYKDKSIPFDEKPKKLKELAEKELTGDLLEQFKKFSERVEQHRNEYKEKVAKLSKDAKAAYDKIEKLEEEKRQLISSLDEDARDELLDLFHSRRVPGHFGFLHSPLRA